MQKVKSANFQFELHLFGIVKGVISIPTGCFKIFCRCHNGGKINEFGITDILYVSREMMYNIATVVISI